MKISYVVNIQMQPFGSIHKYYKWLTLVKLNNLVNVSIASNAITVTIAIIIHN